MKLVKYFVFTFSLSLLMLISIDAQNPNLVKRYVTVELFTNTPCPVCVAQNPGFFDLVSNYPNDIHLISFYPGRPYNTCPLYLSNPSENAFRTSHRNVSGTPRVWINGDISKSSGQVNAADIDRYVEDKSFVSLTVEETGSVMVTATVRVQVYETPPFATGRLFVAAIEKDVTLTGIPSSWEKKHYGVFRKFASTQDGMIVDLLNNDDFTISFDYLANPDWDLQKVHLVAWIEHPETKEIWNSGTRFDPLSGSIEISKHLSMDISPNPVSDQLNVTLPDNFNLAKFEILDISGKSVLATENTSNIDLSHLSAGNYMIIAWSKNSEHIVSQFTKK